MPSPAPTRAMWESNSIATCAIRGAWPVPSYIRRNHWRQMVPSGVATQASSTRSRGETRVPAGQPVLARHDHVGDVVGHGGADEVLGDVQRHVAPAVHDAEVLLAGGDEVDRVPGLALGEGELEVGVLVQQGADHRRHQAAHGGREGRDPQPPGHPTGVAVQAGLELLEVGEEPRPSPTRRRPCSVSITPRPTRSSSATPACFSSRLTCWETALGVKPRASAAPTTEPWCRPRAGRQGDEIDHVAMLQRYVHIHLLVLYGSRARLVDVNTRDSLLAALVATIWGFNFVVIDWGMADVPPLLFVAIRFAAVLLPAIFFSLGPMRRGAAPGGRGVHVPGPVRLPVRRHVRRHAARTGRPGAPGAGRLHDRDRCGLLREVPTPAQAAGVAVGVVGLVIVGVGRGGTCRWPRSRSACWRRCHGGSATSSRGRHGCPAVCR